MFNSVQIFRRLLTLRSYKPIIVSGYCDNRKVNETDGKESAVRDSSAVGSSEPQVKTNHVEAESRNSSSASSEFRTTSTESVDEKLSTKSNNNEEKSDTGVLQVNSASPAKENLEDLPDTGKKLPKKTRFKNNGSVIEIVTSNKRTKPVKSPSSSEKKTTPETESAPSFELKAAETFATLLRKSHFINLGDPVGKVVLGEIFLVVENDLYIDFGWKFHTVCPLPKKDANFYRPGAKVYLKIKDLELSARFLGQKNYISLLEADCTLLGVVKRKGEAPPTIVQEEKEE